MNRKLGRNIRHYRKLKGFTIEELGERAGVCHKYVGEIERGEKTPSVTILQKIASALEMHTGLLLISLATEEKHFSCMASINKILHCRDVETLNKIGEILRIAFEEKS